MDTIKMKKGVGPGNTITYPITQDQIDKLRNSDLVNPKVGNNHGLKLPDDFDQMEAAQEILKVRMQVNKGIYPIEFLAKYWPYNFDMPNHLPKAFDMANLSFTRPQELATVVHMDDPIDLPLLLKKALTNPMYGGTANIKEHTTNYKQFLETVVDINETITDYQKRYGHKAFEVKSYFGLGRPEEVLPELGVLMTAFPEGCPCHGSTVQGHLALSQAGVAALHNDLDLTEDQIQELLYASYLWGQFRCLAGVHYGIDGVMSIMLIPGFDKYIDKTIKKKYKA